jgi:hypothetical protein
MAKLAWQFTLDNQEHAVSAQVDLLYGIRSVQVDGMEDVPAQEGRFDTAALRNFTLAGHSLQVMKFSGGAGLLLDGQALPNQPGGTLPARLRKYEEQRAFWVKLAELTGLKPVPRADGLLEFRNRLIGTQDNRLVVLEYSVSYQFMQPRIAISTRFGAEKDLNGLRGKIESDPALLDLLKRLRRPTLEMTIQSAGAAILLPYNLHKTTPEQAAGDIRTLLNIVKKYTKPVPLSYCDWGGCKSAVHPRELVFYNHSPLLVCSTCMPALEKAGQSNLARYRKSTPGFWKAASAGLLIALLAGIFFGIWKYSLVLAIASFALYFAIVWAMNRVMVKRTYGLLWLAGGMTLISVLIATVTEATLKLMRTLTDTSQIEYGMVFAQPESIRLLWTNLGIGVILTAFTMWFVLHQQRQAVYELTHPTIEHSGVQE